METIKQTLVPKIQSAAKASELHTEVYKALAMRERASARSDIDAIFRELEEKLKKQLNYFKFLDVWKELEEANLGTLVHGRSGNPNRFVWKVNFKHLGRTALGLDKEETPAFRAPLRKVKKAEPVEQPPHNVTFVIPASVPVEEIMALMTLGATLTAKTENKSAK